ncbi:unnamed protein product [Cyprideis torosa]|uniref:Uncharacterized protein n=1 Tax=Cyprideis torosa TaxID=163714 RepID=A0A7R8W4A6_9CRUS|nr:unnamed protein product [Cyprideis torosa]CAG0884006.1 unnamed protein product [Cyprideis torosa]
MRLAEEVATAVRLLQEIRLPEGSNDDLELLLSALQSPFLNEIIGVQDSLRDVEDTFAKHPSLVSDDFQVQGKRLRLLNPPLPSPANELPVEGGGAVGGHHFHGGRHVGVQPDVEPSALSEWQARAGRGRQVFVLTLKKPPGATLGFTLVGLKSHVHGELGIYVQEIQPGGLAAADGQLREGDQVIGINGKALDQDITHEAAIELLQAAYGSVQLVVAREFQSVLPPPPVPSVSRQSAAPQTGAGPTVFSPSPTEGEESSYADDSVCCLEEVLLGSRSAEVEEIELTNDENSGLGFGIVEKQRSGKKGVFIKTIVPYGIAARDGRLQSGDLLLMIGEEVLRGMNSEEVAAVLWKAGHRVRLVVARAADPRQPSTRGLPQIDVEQLADPEQALSLSHQIRSMVKPEEVSSSDEEEEGSEDRRSNSETVQRVTAELPEVETFEVVLIKDSLGLGITIAGYVCEEQGLRGVFVKNISRDSAADRSKMIRINDQIIEVDGVSLSGFNNHQAVELLRSTGKAVQLKLARYLRGPRLELLQEALSSQQLESGSASKNQAPQYQNVYAQKVGLPPPPPPLPPTVVEGVTQDETSTDDLGIPPPPTEAADGGSPPLITTPPPSDLPPLIPATSSPPPFSSPYHQPPQTPSPPMALGGPYSPIHPQPTTMGLPPPPTLPQEQSPPSAVIPTTYVPQEKPSEIVQRWSAQFSSSRVRIVMAQILRLESDSTLGINLQEGGWDMDVMTDSDTTDGEGSKSAQNTFPRHFVTYITQDGPVGRDGTVQVGDELLEVDGVVLQGKEPSEVLAIMRCLPRRDTLNMVVARAQQDLMLEEEDGGYDIMNVASTIGRPRSADEGYEPHQRPSSAGALIKSKSEGSLSSSLHDSPSLSKSRSLEPLDAPALWCTETEVIELIKGDGGLGFSILDYQDPVNPTETMIVVRSLVQGGVAHLDGRLVPGDRIIAVNEICLKNSTLDAAVGVLKGAPRGIVQIEVAKPLGKDDIDGAMSLQSD